MSATSNMQALHTFNVTATAKPNLQHRHSDPCDENQPAVASQRARHATHSPGHSPRASSRRRKPEPNKSAVQAPFDRENEKGKAGGH